MNAGAPTAPHQRLHTRQIVCHGYLRDDGLLDIEGRLQDSTGVATDMPFGALPADGTIHDMRLVMTLDREMVIREMRAVTATGATPFCAEINAAYASLQGLCVGPGFKQQVKQRVGGVKGCTHLTELVNTLGNTAMQTMFSLRRAENASRRAVEPDGPLPRPWVIDTCHAYRSDGEAVQRVWPLHRRAAQPA